ncbi:hypothetical protein KQI86_19120 [Clostridium sp. MSJ-11]|uniref:Uncharacterized protein n=1 Tax=Clostridium mobile TaxID=2841512 RepID=A0ABS6EPV7_9CLOT|nr:hypothetical protein [Clostridium mobile]MBU5486415.1 hypothetical protein [Clostridium mobile]
MRNKRYIRLAKKMKAYCNGRCSGEDWMCKYYKHCFHRYILCPKLDSLRYLQKRLKGQKIKSYEGR